MTRSAALRTHLLIASAVLCAATSAPVRAASKVWVSTAGTDSATCGAVTSPCRSFQKAHDNVDAGGEIGVLTPGDYGTVIIRKSVNITDDGTGEASALMASATVGITINAGVGDVVSLRGLVIDGQGIGNPGIFIAGGSAIHIQNCVVRNVADSFGVYFQPSHDSRLFISDTLIFNNGVSADSGGILVGPYPGPASVVLDRVRLENNVNGLEANGTHGGVRVALRHSVVSGNAGNGIHSFRPSGSGASTVVLVNNSAAVGNAGPGVLADGDGIVLLSNSMIEYNGTGASVTNGGRLFTYGNNLIDNNTGEDLSPAALTRTGK